MKNKVKRLAAIQRIVSTSAVSSQEELLQRLVEEGFELTQATLSRDLKKMKVTKTTNAAGEYIYRMTAQESAEEPKTTETKTRPGGMATSIEFSGNIAVIHTRAGYASGLAYEIDERAKDVIIGTVAGEDTLLAVIKENTTRTAVLDSLSKLEPTLSKQ